MNMYLLAVPEVKVRHVIEDMTQDVDWVTGRPDAQEVAHTATTLLLDELVDCPPHSHVSSRELSLVVDAVCPTLQVDHNAVLLRGLCQLYGASQPSNN